MSPKSLRIVALLAVLAVALTACAPSTAIPVATQPAPTQAPAAVPTQAPAPTQLPAPTEAPAVTQAPAATATQAAPAPTEAATQPAAPPTAAAQAQAATAEPAAKTLRLPDLKGRKVSAVTGNDFTPLNFVDPATGKAVGWEYDAINEICRRLNCTVDWKAASWDTMIAAIHDKQFDVGAEGITITPERKQQVDFSEPYMTAQQFMLVRADENRFKTPEEFRANPKLLIGSQTGTTNFYVAVNDVLKSNEQDPRIKLFDNFGAAVQALIAGDVDMVLMDQASSKGYIGANPNKLKVVGAPLSSEDYGFIFPPKSDLVAPFNAAISTMKQDGFMDHLNTRWFFMYDPSSK